MYTFFGVNFILRNFVCVKEMTNIRYDPDPPVVHLAPRRADLEQVFAGANFNTEKISGAHVEVSGAHFKVLSIIKSLRSTVESLLKVSGAQFNEIMSRIEALFLANTCNNGPD